MQGDEVQQIVVITAIWKPVKFVEKKKYHFIFELIIIII